jgi:hypothetical protein
VAGLNQFETTLPLDNFESPKQQYRNKWFGLVNIMSMKIKIGI